MWVQYSLGYRIHSDTGPRVPGPVFIVTRFLLPVCLSSALTSFLSPRKFSIPYFAYFFAVKWLGLSFTSSLSSASGTVPHPQFLNLSLLWSAVSAARRFGSFTRSAEVKGTGLFWIFHPHGSACAMFRVKRVNLHLRNDVRMADI